MIKELMEEIKIIKKFLKKINKEDTFNEKE